MEIVANVGLTTDMWSSDGSPESSPGLTAQRIKVYWLHTEQPEAHTAGSAGGRGPVQL